MFTLFSANSNPLASTAYADPALFEKHPLIHPTTFPARQPRSPGLRLANPFTHRHLPLLVWTSSKVIGIHEARGFAPHGRKEKERDKKTKRNEESEREPVRAPSMAWPCEVALTAKTKKKSLCPPSNHWLTIRHMSLQIRKILPTFHRPFLLVLLSDMCDSHALSGCLEQHDLVGKAWVLERHCCNQPERFVHSTRLTD